MGGKLQTRRDEGTNPRGAVLNLTVRLSLDPTHINAQIGEVISILGEAAQPMRDHAHRLLLEYLGGLESDIAFTENVVSTGADGTIEVRCAMRLGAGFEHLLAAIQTGQLDEKGGSHA